MERKILINRIKTPDGTILTSYNRHDMVTHVDANGEYYFTDGGTAYLRRSVNKIPAEDMSIYTDSPFDEIRTELKRGTFNKKGERIWVPLKELSDKHLENILSYNKNLMEEANATNTDTFSEMIVKEIEYRKEHGIEIPEHDYE